MMGVMVPSRHSWFAKRVVIATFVFLTASLDVARSAERSGLVLLANRAMPGSVELAQRYCTLREIPEAQICVLDLPVDESMSRADYETRLRDPLLSWLRANGWIEQVKRNPRRVQAHETEWTTVKSKVQMLCSFYGVPLRIEDTKPFLAQKMQNWINHAPQRDEAATDSELVMLLQGPYDIRGRLGNPFLGQLRWGSPDANAFYIMATRLDGPDPETVQTMMDGALEAERYGLHGRAYIDMRAAHDDGYLIGDFWLSEAANRLSREGYQVTIEATDQLFSRNDPMDRAAFYLGWYTEQVTGPFLRDGFTFQPGALAYHNHSGNAKSLRTRTEHWSGPLLARGAAATWGAVSEPFLGTTPQLHILVDRLCRGATLAEATYLALPVLSWQITVIGDPLYRPFALSLDEQIKKLEAEDRPEVEWAWLRKVDVLVQEGRFNIALAYARNRLRVRDGVLLHEKIAELLAMNNLAEEALPDYEKAVALADNAETALRIGVRYLSLLRALGKGEQAATAETALRQRWSGSSFLQLLSRAHPTTQKVPP